MPESRDEPGRPDGSTTPSDPGALKRLLADALDPEFEVLRLIGSGRMAHVFLARELALQRLVAVKVLRPEAGANDVARARFEREAHSAAGISHPCVPTVHRIGRLASGLPYIVQEFVRGRTLRERLAASGVPGPGEARRLLADLASALAAAHASGVIHRDVRPGNVILERETGRAVLTDFGVAAVRETGATSPQRLTREGEILGDPGYSSPEELRAESVTEQADIFSLGLIGFEILTGSLPHGFTGRDSRALAARLRSPPVRLPAALHSRDPVLGELLSRCLVKEPARRPRAAEIAQRLEAGEDDPAGESDGSGAATRLPEHPFLDLFPRSVVDFVEELRRRRVYQVTAGYLVASFVVLEASQLVLSGLGGPPWVFSALAVVAVTGLPVVAVVAWIYELSSGEIRRTEPIETESRFASRLKLLQMMGLLASVVLAALLGWLLLR